MMMAPKRKRAKFVSRGSREEAILMWTYFLVGLGGGMALGAILLDRMSIWRHMKSYDQFIKDDFDLQGRLLEGITLSRHTSPFSEFLQTISPEFCRLYGEAWVAERAPLPQAAGLAYAKSLELLIKDFAKLENPGEAAKIETTNLSTCVREFLKDDLLRNSAELGVWLRNDQVHYRRKYTEHGTTELRKIIKRVVGLIEDSERRKKLSANVARLREQMVETRADKSVKAESKPLPPTAGHQETP
jgi:hypothetical protein